MCKYKAIHTMFPHNVWTPSTSKKKIKKICFSRPPEFRTCAGLYKFRCRVPSLDSIEHECSRDELVDSSPQFLKSLEYRSIAFEDLGGPIRAHLQK